MPTCPLTGQAFEPSPEEMALRAKLKVEGEPTLHPLYRLLHLGAFWQHWALHKRTCDKTGQSIISVYPLDCPYPVWHKDEWVKGTDPPGADFQAGQPVFPQLWEFFRKSPIAHNVGVGCENCEYTDDFWHSKNCYLCHSGFECEDLRYCYRTVQLRTCRHCVFSFDSERCVDLINCHNCYNVLFAQNCWQCSDSAFLYDCRNCSDCILSCNLRNKRFVFQNEQLDEVTYRARRQEWDLRSRQVYQRGCTTFDAMMREQALHRALQIDQCEHATGNYLTGVKDCQDCFFLTEQMEGGIHCLRGGWARDCLDCVGMAFQTELCYCSLGPQENCYDIRFCIDVIECKWMEYCAHCFQSEHCFGCCGLVGKKYHIFNQPVSEAEYEARVETIRTTMRETGEYGRFFPGSFAATPYQESLSGFHWPLDRSAAQRYGFRFASKERKRPADTLDASTVPDHTNTLDDDLLKRTFWDETSRRPFRIESADIAFAQDIGAPLPSSYYMTRIQSNFRRIPFTGLLRETTCGKCKQSTRTGWPEEYDGRILCEECYLSSVY